MIKIRVAPKIPRLLNKRKKKITNIHAASNNRSANIMYSKNSIVLLNHLLFI